MPGSRGSLTALFRKAAMRTAMSVLAFGLVLLAATPSSAQATATGESPSWQVSILGLASIHPVDGSYVGAPYLDHGLGGVGPGVAVMVDVVAATGPTLVVEFSVADVEVFQTGRLVDGRDTTGAGGATGRLRDPMVSILGGYTFGSAATTTLVAGAGYADTVPTQDDERIDRFDDPAVQEGAGHLAIVGGAHARRALSDRFALVASGRYALVPRSRRAEELGASRHLFRLGLGLSIRVGR